MSTTSFQPIAVGTIEGSSVSHGPLVPLPEGNVTIHYPARLEAMALDPSKVAEREDRIYRAGQINFIVDIFKHVTVRIVEGDGEIVIADGTPRPALVRHAALMMQRTLGFGESIAVEVREDVSLRHCGLGSSSNIIAAVASAINELFSRPLSPSALSQLCAQNHGEEIDGDDARIVPVQCLGGSVIGGNYQGGLMVVAGRATPIFTMDLPSNVSVVIGVPEEYQHPDSAELMKQEADNMEGFVSSGETYANEIAYTLVHSVLPDLVNGSLAPCKELIYQYRWNMGSIKNCSFALPRIVDIAETLRKYQNDPDIEIFSLSSVGPGFFALTTNVDKVVKDFHDLKMTTLVASIHNGTYKVGE
jgi:predicted sugar kinase